MMDRRTAKELLHVEGWLARSAEIVARGKDAYLSDAMLQEAGDSLMMKLGEAAGRLDRLDVPAPNGVQWSDAISNRNFLIHQYDEIDREISWGTLSVDLAGWQRAVTELVAQANDAIDRDQRG
ncbi:DUF86 domain-containing protein [Nocardioides alpinus]|uniref:DUF86 domain-containing protein n=2 Tax=Nocardioides alpinus TaxID=748909 RepID=A0ABX4QUR1_9ACTN|nr:DUF86 domain-containing protein [Nocardioides alpinus]